MRRAAPGLLVVGVVLVVLALLRGRDFADALSRAIHADWRWALVAAAFEAGSLLGYVALLHRVLASASRRWRWRDSYDVAMGGAAAARLLPTAGLGGIGVAAWALRAHGLSRRELSERLVAFNLLIYSVYLAALIVSGVAIATGIVAVSQGSGLGFFGALAGAAAIMAVLAGARVPARGSRVLLRLTQRGGRVGALSTAVNDALPGVRAGIARAGRVVHRPRPVLLGAVAWWGFDMGVLLAMLHAFGASPSVVVLVFAYFVGTLFNLVPLPGSLSGGLVGALVAFGVAPGAGIGAVLAYRAIAIWLPATAGLPSLVSLRASVLRWRRDQQQRDDAARSARRSSLATKAGAGS